MEPKGTNPFGPDLAKAFGPRSSGTGAEHFGKLDSGGMYRIVDLSTLENRSTTIQSLFGLDRLTPSAQAPEDSAGDERLPPKRRKLSDEQKRDKKAKRRAAKAAKRRNR